MATLRQIEANRRNALKSTGPTSVTGKAASSMNALKTGIHAKSLVLPTENVAELEELIAECYCSLHPTTLEARCFVDEFIFCEWNLRRLRAAETESWRQQDEDSFQGPQKYPLGYSVTNHGNTFSRLQYRMDATRRARERALRSLKQLQADAEAAPPPPPAAESAGLPSPSHSFQTTSPQIGFVSPTPISTPSQPLPQDSVCPPTPVRIGFVSQSANSPAEPLPMTARSTSPLDSCSQSPSLLLRASSALSASLCVKNALKS